MPSWRVGKCVRNYSVCMRILWKKYELLTKASLLRILLKKLRVLHAPEDLEPLFKFLYILYICQRESPGKNYRQIDGKSKSSFWRNLSTGMPPKFFQYNPFLCSLKFTIHMIWYWEYHYFVLFISRSHQKFRALRHAAVSFFAVTGPDIVKQIETLSHVLSQVQVVTSLINLLFGRYLANNDFLIITYSL